VLLIIPGFFFGEAALRSLTETLAWIVSSTAFELAVAGIPAELPLSVLTLDLTRLLDLTMAMG